jgi:hypothetical protein
MTILAPSLAHLSAISRPMPRLAPVMKMVLPLRLAMVKLLYISFALLKKMINSVLYFAKYEFTKQALGN